MSTLFHPTLIHNIQTTLNKERGYTHTSTLFYAKNNDNAFNHLVPMLTSATSANDCMNILIYLYNAPRQQEVISATESNLLLTLSQKLRLDIWEILVTQHPEIVRTINQFSTSLNKKLNQAHQQYQKTITKPGRQYSDDANTAYEHFTQQCANYFAIQVKKECALDGLSVSKPANFSLIQDQQTKQWSSNWFGSLFTTSPRNHRLPLMNFEMTARKP